jgi:hypothetical protein
MNDWRRILWFLALAGILGLFCLDGARAQSQSILLVAPPPPAVSSVTAQITASGLGTYCEWVIAIYPVGKSAASSPACVSNAGGSISVSWSPAGVGVTGYDVLRTTAPSLPSGAWNGAVATNVPCCSQTDNLGALSSYTLTAAPPAQATLRLDNQTGPAPRIYSDTPFTALQADVATIGTTAVDARRGVLSNVPALVASSGLVTVGLEALYLFREKAGVTVLDYSGKGNHGTVVGTPSWQPTGISFPAITQYVAIPDAAWTVMRSAAWVATTPGGGAEGFLAASVGASHKALLYTGGKLQVYASGGSYPTGEAARTAGTRVTTYVSNATADHIYTDGYEAAYEAGKNGSTTSISMGTAAKLGVHSSGGFSGTVSFLALYSIELTQLQVAQNAAAIRKLLVGRGATTSTLVFSGDSITAGLSASAGNDYPTQLLNSIGASFTTTNLGHSGYSTTQLLAIAKTNADVDNAYSIFNPRHVVVFWAGTNDLFQAVGTPNGGVNSLATVVSNTVQFCADRKAAGFDVCLVLTTIARNLTDTGLGPSFVDRFALNRSLKAGCTGACDGVIDIAADPLFASTAGTGNTAVYTDLTHLTDFGYGIVAQIVRQALVPYLVF